MSKQKDIELMKHFLTLNRDAFIKEINKSYFKSYLKGSSVKENYGLALTKIGYGEIYEVTDPNQLVEGYLISLVTAGCALYDTEIEIYADIDKEKKADILSEPIPYATFDYFGGHNLTEDKYTKLNAVSKYISTRFTSTTTWYSRFMRDEITGEELVEQIEKYIISSYQILIEDTNVAYCIPRHFGASKNKVYLPSSIDFSEISPEKYLCNEVVMELNSERKFGLTAETFNSATSILKELNTYFTLPMPVKHVQTLLDLECTVRHYMIAAIDSLLEPLIKLGKPFTLENTKTPNILAVGNYDETISIYSGDISFRVGKDSLGTVQNLLQTYKICKVKKIASIDKDGDKIPIWSQLFSNSTPRDKDHNNIVKQNVV